MKQKTKGTKDPVIFGITYELHKSGKAIVRHPENPDALLGILSLFEIMRHGNPAYIVTRSLCAAVELLRRRHPEIYNEAIAEGVDALEEVLDDTDAQFDILSPNPIHFEA